MVDLMAFCVLILSGGPVTALPIPACAVQEEQRSDAQDLERDYARRDREAGPLEEFRGGAGAGGLEILVLPLFALGGLMKLLVSALSGR